MMVSTRGRYALRTMIDIARHSDDGFISLKEISRREDISMKYLEQVVSSLVKANLLTGLRGSKGGYRLSRTPDQYTALEILTVMEGPMAPVQCLRDEKNQCTRCGICTTVDFWKGFNDVVNNYLRNITLDMLVKDADAKVFSDFSI